MYMQVHTTHTDLFQRDFQFLSPAYLLSIFFFQTWQSHIKGLGWCLAQLLSNIQKLKTRSGVAPSPSTSAQNLVMPET